MSFGRVLKHRALRSRFFSPESRYLSGGEKRACLPTRQAPLLPIIIGTLTQSKVQQDFDIYSKNPALDNTILFSNIDIDESAFFQQVLVESTIYFWNFGELIQIRNQLNIRR